MAGKVLPVAWHDQRNNTLSPYGTCNATSIAAVMQFLGITFGWDGQGQLDDYVTRLLDTPEAWTVHRRTLPDWQSCNPRNNPYVLKWLLERMGLKDKFEQRASASGQIMPGSDPFFKDIMASIDRGMPVICAGTYTYDSPVNGRHGIVHINVVVGYNDFGLVFCDPFGNPNTNYQSAFGDHVAYSWRMCDLALSQKHILERI